jgi:ABC-type branched-subunit amino acid transport system substrate-binding protein
VAANDGRLPTRSQVAAAVRATEGYEGVTGEISFTEKGDLRRVPYFIVEVTSSQPDFWHWNEHIDTRYFD